jgi:hypothetical protein
VSLALGKRPATSDPRDLQFAEYVRPEALPPPPPTFGHDGLIETNSWRMLGNDVAGDCVWAGAAHETMLWKAEVKQAAHFSAASVLSDYSAFTGYDPVSGANDDGTNVREALGYRRSTGILDANGRRHKILAYVALTPGDMTQLWQALYLFGAVGIGFEFPESAWADFDAGRKWSVIDGSRIDGGHYVPVVARRDGVRFVTWGVETAMTKAFYKTYCDEAWAILSNEPIVNQRSPEGFDLATLRADLALLA